MSCDEFGYSKITFSSSLYYMSLADSSESFRNRKKIEFLILSFRVLQFVPAG